MKLRNKQTGEIKEWDFGNWYQHIINPDNKESYECNLNDFIGRTVKFREEWEDVPEDPKGINEIDVILDAIGEYCDEHSYYSGDLEKIKILNAVEEKLKAWKRLKDKEFRFAGWYTSGDATNTIRIYAEFPDVELGPIVGRDLALLFGGEE